MDTSEQIIKVIDNLCEKFGIVIDWSSNNVLPYIQQLGDKIVKYDLYTSVFWLVLCILGVVASVFTIKIIYKQYKEIKTTNKDNLFFELVYNVPSATPILIILSIVLISLLIFSVIGIIFNTNYIIQDLTFPEKTIIEFVKPYLS